MTKTPAQALFYGLLAATAAVVLFYAAVDRPFAEWVRPASPNPPVFVMLTYPAKICTPVASIALIICAFRVLARGRATTTEAMIIAACCGVLVAGVLTFQLKELFGRTWPETWVNNNPSYFGTGVYGFFPFKGGTAYAAFPSGHMTAISSFAAGLAFVWPRLRWLAVAVVLCVGAGLAGASYHWLSDMIAGTTIGVSCAFASSRLARQFHVRETAASQSR
jgi:membrane-associated phospholipid phosphatase